MTQCSQMPQAWQIQRAFSFFLLPHCRRSQIHKSELLSGDGSLCPRQVMRLHFSTRTFSPRPAVCTPACCTLQSDIHAWSFQVRKLCVVCIGELGQQQNDLLARCCSRWFMVSITAGRLSVAAIRPVMDRAG